MSKITHNEIRKQAETFSIYLEELLLYITQQEKQEKEHETELKIAVRNIETLQQSLHELNISDKGKEESSMQYFNDYKDLKRKYNKLSKLLDLYKELSIIRFYLFSEKDSDLGQELMDKDTLILKEIKELEKGSDQDE